MVPRVGDQCRRLARRVSLPRVSGFYIAGGARDCRPLPHTPILATTMLPSLRSRQRFRLTIPISLGNIEVPASLRSDA
jgi:hypothetical protein